MVRAENRQGNLEEERIRGKESEGGGEENWRGERDEEGRSCRGSEREEVKVAIGKESHNLNHFSVSLFFNLLATACAPFNCSHN